MMVSTCEEAATYTIELANTLTETLATTQISSRALERALILSHEVCGYLEGTGAEDILRHHYREDTFTEYGIPTDHHEQSLEQERLRGRALRGGLGRALQETDPLRQRRQVARLLVRAICLAIDIPLSDPPPINLVEAMVEARRLYNTLDMACQGHVDPHFAAFQIEHHSQALHHVFNPKRSRAVA
ncbi:MAG: hypothetical protein AAFV53_08000 [Myxococcota bacterium]